MSGTPETDAQALIRPTIINKMECVSIDFARRMEKERNAFRVLALELAKELATKCGDVVHRPQVSELQKDAPYWMRVPHTVCTSTSLGTTWPNTEH
jgi:hypothetical protein